MDTFLASLVLVALAEVGDKTQLLSLILAARYRKPVPIVLGILVATLANHFLAGALGAWIQSLLSPQALRWIVGCSLLAVAAWTLKPDKFEGEVREETRYGVFALTCVVFFIAEMGDKTQVATVILAVQHQALAMVVFGTTAGMLVANAPVVWLANAGANRIPFRAVRVVAALLFAAMGLAALFTDVGG
ncbi:MAG: TMEM165/GDT1 family protein [Burkholderiales bacterium]|nr:TMEM165/GDT1 family protein [Burkholderiales bacterium]